MYSFVLFFVRIYGDHINSQLIRETRMPSDKKVISGISYCILVKKYVDKPFTDKTFTIRP